MLDFVVRSCVYVDVVHFRKIAAKENTIIRDSKGSNWICAESTEGVHGCVCADRLGNTMRFRADFVLPEYRKQGIYREMFRQRMELTFDEFGMERVTAFCTEMSLPVYLENGFKIIKMKQIKRGNGTENITFVELCR